MKTATEILDTIKGKMIFEAKYHEKSFRSTEYITCRSIIAQILTEEERKKFYDELISDLRKEGVKVPNC